MAKKKKRYFNQDLAEIRRLKQMMIAELAHYTNYGMDIEDYDFHSLANLCSQILPVEEY